MSSHGVFPCLGLIVRVCKSINKEECIVEVVRKVNVVLCGHSCFVQKDCMCVKALCSIESWLCALI
jgi:hypothetical protein